MEKTLYFNQCTLPLLDKTFGLRCIASSAVLDHWLQRASQIELSEFEQQCCVMLQTLLLSNAHSWQEQEMSLYFIGPMFSLVKFTELYRFNLSAQRRIEAKLGDYLLTGDPDGLIASSYYEPEIPYFAFGEYKRQRDPSGDPMAQALAAMLAGQVLNQNKRPLYGCYVIGRDWNFMVLEDTHYAVSRGYSALSDGVYDILRTLKALREIMMEITA